MCFVRGLGSRTCIGPTFAILAVRRRRPIQSIQLCIITYVYKTTRASSSFTILYKNKNKDWRRVAISKLKWTL